MNPKGIIEQIAEERRCEFSSGPSLRNALRVIVERLNSQETHFLLELIQNADDALKDADGENPRKLTFTLKQDRLIIQNSGKPFDANDVHALSSVGDSHKGFDQIGHFGIGFKSVFRVCDYPEVYSGGFSFRYNAIDETWIVPEWLDAPTEEYNDVLSFDCDKNGNWNPIEIEVKSTPYPSGDTGILSNEQWEYAKDHAEIHRLYIVYLAKSDKPVVRRLKFGEWAITPHTYNIIC